MQEHQQRRRCWENDECKTFETDEALSIVPFLSTSFRTSQGVLSQVVTSSWSHIFGYKSHRYLIKNPSIDQVHLALLSKYESIVKAYLAILVDPIMGPV